LTGLPASSSLAFAKIKQLKFNRAAHLYKIKIWRGKFTFWAKFDPKTRVAK
jgi:hypothetical protein